MLNILKNLLQQIISDIDAGNSNITEEDQIKIIDFIQKCNSEELSKIESANYIGVCRATFDNYINKGLIPKGKKRQGFNELSWSKKDLDKFLNDKNNKQK